MEKKLKVKYSTFKSPLTFNEWAKQYKVSSLHTENTPYYTGNLTEMDWNSKSDLFNSLEQLFPKRRILDYFKIKFK